MSQMGHSRHPEDVPSTSGLLPKADKFRAGWHVSNVPNPDNAVLFNHLIGTSDDRRRNDEGECLALRLNDD
jgi:hypothetical protein